jgi:hypothetical protein
LLLHDEDRPARHGGGVGGHRPSDLAGFPRVLQGDYSDDGDPYTTMPSVSDREEFADRLEAIRSATLRDAAKPLGWHTFLDKDGKPRAYDTYAPPTKIEWPRLQKRLKEWNTATTPQDVDGNDPYILLTESATPDPDFYASEDTAHSVSLFESRLKPAALTMKCWCARDEEILREHGIKLSGLQTITLTGSGVTFGVRIFHINYRYFAAVILDGTDYDPRKTEFVLEASPQHVIGYYYLSMSVDEAIDAKCV